MKKAASILRYLFFCIFFVLGASAITLSILSDEITQNYKNIENLNLIEENSEKLERLIKAYDLQIEQVMNDPEILKRLSRRIVEGVGGGVGVGADPVATRQELRIATEILNPPSDPNEAVPLLRSYAERATKQHVKQGLFLSGAGLILIAFIFFGEPKQKKEEQTENAGNSFDAE